MADLQTNLQRLESNSDEISYLVTDISDAIIAKGGTLPSNAGLRSFPAAIGTIPSSGGGTSNDVNFYDYDGSIVKSYSAEEFANISSLPANPTHTGLTSQGWNWSLSDAKTYVATYGELNIGQQYVTNDGKTRIYINLTEGKISPLLMLYLNANSELDIDWGDGSIHSTWTTTSASYKSERHNYPDKGKYVIVITVVSGSFILQSQSTSYNTFFTDGKNNAESSDRVYLKSIQKIEIGTGISQIGNYVFYNCHSLSSITIPNNVTSIGNTVFANCYSLSSITIPNNVTSIGNTVFAGCYSLSSITIPNSVTSIGTYAFQYCSSLSSITIPNNVTSIGNNAFYTCSSLSSITIPNNVTTIGESAFYQCYSLYSITIGNSVTSIKGLAFSNCYSLSSVTIPDGVTTIENAAFNNCYSLSTITIPGSVTKIWNTVFANCYSLSSITIPNNVTSIDANTFSKCYALSSITIPDGVTTIGNSAFQTCSSLSSITIPDSVTSIGNNAFYNCSSMGYIRFTRSTPPTVQASNAWSYVSTTTIIYVPALVSNLYMNGTNYPNKATYKYVGYATYASGDSLPTSIPGYSLTWYATIEDWIADTNPITVGNGNEVYAKTAIVTSITRETDFVNNVTTRSTNAIEALNVYRNMKRCNVADDGTINAYDGDLTYTEDGSNGQVMVKVNKFYYKLDVSQTGDLDGVNIRTGRWSIADTKVDNNYKLHPAFLAADGVTELDYFLYGAFDAVGQDSNGTYSTSYNTTSYKLGSVGGNLYAPSNSFTRATARTMATNRGTGWYSAGVKQTMAIQMLFAVEYGFNSQTTLGNGIVNALAASNTGTTIGSTSSGDLSGETTAVNYRGIENFWGNVWNWIDGINFSDRTPYICNSYSFADDTSSGYTSISFNLPSSNYIKALGYDSTNDWILLPSESSSTSADSGPIGDYVDSSSSWRVAQLGGGLYYGSDAGAFYWGGSHDSSYPSLYIGARVMFIP